MSENTLAIKVTADVVDLQTKFGVAKAEAAALTSEFSKLAKQSAAGLLDPNGLAQLQEASRALLEAKNDAKELQDQLKGTHEESVNLGEGLEEIRGKIGTAFQATGIAAAYEAVKMVGEAISHLGERATQMHTMSEVLGVTTDQFQAMSLAAEEGGTSIELFARASERLRVTLLQARDGSGAAVEKLLALGITTKQIADPTFQVNEILGVLHDRLTDAATKQDEMNELIKEFGPRMAPAIAAFIAYDASAQGAAAAMAKQNGMSDEQVAKLHKQHAAWELLKTRIENASSKALVGAAAVGDWLAAHSSTLRALGSAVGAQVTEQSKPNAGTIDRSSQDAARAAAQEQKDLQREIAQQELENIKAGIEAYKQGTAERLAQVRLYAAEAAKYYGSDEVDKVKAAKTAEIAEIRAFNEAQIAVARETMRQDDAAVRARLAGIKLVIDANEQYFTEEVKIHDAIRSMEETGLELQTHVYNERAKTTAQLTKLTEKETRDQLQEWQFLTNGMKSGFDSAIKGMLSGTETFGQAVRGVFTSIFDAIIGELAQWAAEWITQHLIALTVTKTTAVDEVVTAAGVAAANAMASVAAIPFVGWAMAPEVGASTYAEAIAIGMPKMDVGAWNVPHDMVAQIHKGEAVVPANFAEGMRQNGGFANQGGGGAVGNATHVHAHFHVKALDSRDTAAYFRQNGSAIVDALGEQLLRFHPALR